MSDPSKTPGQIAYEAELQARPYYHDGAHRRPWDKLSEPVKYSWEKNPTPRWNTPNVAGG